MEPVSLARYDQILAGINLGQTNSKPTPAPSKDAASMKPAAAREKPATPGKMTRRK